MPGERISGKLAQHERITTERPAVPLLLDLIRIALERPDLPLVLALIIIAFVLFKLFP